jgi:hypothetical protein
LGTSAFLLAETESARYTDHELIPPAMLAITLKDLKIKGLSPQSAG